MPKIVLDTSVIINGLFNDQVNSGHIRNSEIIIPQVVVDELQSQASQNKDQGFLGLKEIKNLKNFSKNFGLDILIQGVHPSLDDIRLSGQGKIDAIIKDTAKENDATLYTSDNVQHLVAQTEGIASVFLQPIIKEEELKFLKYFSPVPL